MTAREALTPQQAAFCEFYIANGRNGTQAAIAAGYGAKSAHVRAHKLLAMDKVQLYLAELVIPAAAKAIDDLGKKAVAMEIREESVTAREEAVELEESLESMRERIKLRMVNALCGMAFTRMDDLASWTESGVQFRPSAELTPEQLEAIDTIESHVSEGETQDGKTLYRNAFLKIKRQDRRGAMKDLRSLLEIGPPPKQRGDPGAQGPGFRVQVIVAGGPTGLELGATIKLQPIAADPGPVAIVRAPIAHSVTAPADNEARGTSSGSAVPAGSKELRAWNPRPRTKTPTPAAPHRAVVSRPTGK